MEPDKELPQVPIQDTNQSAILPEIPKKKFLGKFFAVLIIIVLLAAAAFTYFYAKTYITLNNQLDQMTNTTQPTPSPMISQTIPPSTQIIKLQSTAPDKKKSVKTIVDENAADANKRAIILTDLAANKEQIIYQARFDADSWNTIIWSSDSNYFVVTVGLPDGFDLYAFKTNGQTFSNGKLYLKASEVNPQISGISTDSSWISPFQLKISRNAGVINQKLPDAIFDLNKETFTEVK